MFCRTCGKQLVDQAVVCTGCGLKPRAGGAFCWQCGTATGAQQAVCMNCGVALGQTIAGVTLTGPGKSRTVAGLLNLAVLLPVIPGGIGRLYLGYIGLGVAQLLLTFVCIGWVWSIIDGIMILTGSVNTDADGHPLT